MAARLAQPAAEEKIGKLRNPEYRATMIREALNDPPPIDFSQIFLFPDGEARYDHRSEESLQAHAQRLGLSRPRLLSHCLWKKQVKPSSIILKPTI